MKRLAIASLAAFFTVSCGGESEQASVAEDAAYDAMNRAGEVNEKVVALQTDLENAQADIEDLRLQVLNAANANEEVFRLRQRVDQLENDQANLERRIRSGY